MGSDISLLTNGIRYFTSNYGTRYLSPTINPVVILKNTIGMK